MEGCLDYGLHALAEAAVMSRDRPLQDSISEHSSDPPAESCCGGGRPSMALPDALPAARFELPPILVGPSPSSSIPDFPTIPPLSTIKSIAGSGCTCGLNCTCPGCVEHRTIRHVEKHHKDCSEGCTHCVDHTAGIELPGQDSSTNQAGSSLVDAFFARAAALPNPPLNRRTELGPGDVTVYSHERFGGPDADGRGPSVFGLAQAPKLTCCRGNCGCPTDRCQCGRSYGGCCGGTQS
ncbi:hypothetical protein JVU11DRAFT_5524 [Chiua virens]|nr:hypothetical protein JVU11DRAFT_5524 [Chiua virens]